MRETTPAFTLRPMQEADLPRCLWLTEQVHRNQTPADWRRFRAYDPAGCMVAVKDGEVIGTPSSRAGKSAISRMVAVKDGEVIGTVCTIAYENRFGWVAMVIVDPAHRRQGVGTALLRHAIAHLTRQGLTVKLDATPQGKLLYDTLGFVDEYGVARLEVEQLRVPAPALRCPPLTAADLEAVSAFDAPIFGASRWQVLASYYQDYPHLGFLYRDGQRVRGYILAREGLRAFHIGPWVAEEPEVAAALLSTLWQQRQPERVFIDVPNPNPHVRPLLEGLGFRQQRPFIRMYLGENRHPGKPELIYALSGPEVG